MKIFSRHLILFLSAAGLIFSGCTGKDGKPAENGALTDSVQLAPSGTAPAPVVDTTTAPVADSVAVVTHTAVVVTDMGEMEFELYGKDAPKAVNNFVGLAQKKFYEGIGIHRVVRGFVLQMGDPQSLDSTKYEQWGTGGESIYNNQPFEDELDTNLPSARGGYREGILAMANRGPNTNTSQFFIILRDQQKHQLPYNYTIFGRVRRGMDVAHQIENAAPMEKPRQPVRITKITVTQVAS